MQTILRKQQIPWIMAAARAALGPVVIVGQACRWSGTTLAAMVAAALLSDIFDGVLARRWHCDSPAVRLFDSMADTVFYLCVTAALWIAPARLIQSHCHLLVALLMLEAGRFVFDTGKFGKPASYHSYLAKVWGLLLAVVVITAFAAAGSHASAFLITAALILGIVCNLEGFAMSIILPSWYNDVKTLNAARRLRSFDHHRLLFSANGNPVSNGEIPFINGERGHEMQSTTVVR